MNSTRQLLASLALGALTLLAAGGAMAQAKAPDALIKEVSTDVLDELKADKSLQAGDIQKVTALVDQKVLPYVNFERMTASAVGRYWRQATPDQQKRLEDQFKLLLVRTYSGALSQVSQEQSVELKPMRSSPTDTEVVVRTEIRGKGDPIQLDYRLEKAGDSWKIYDVNVLGVWLVDNYRNSFAQVISTEGTWGSSASSPRATRLRARRAELDRRNLFELPHASSAGHAHRP